MTTLKQLTTRAKMRKAQRWLAERQVEFWMHSATSLEIATQPQQSRIRYFPLTGGVRIGNWYVSERGLYALETVLIDTGILSEDAPLVAVDRRNLPEWEDPSFPSPMQLILRSLRL